MKKCTTTGLVTGEHCVTLKPLGPESRNAPKSLKPIQLTLTESAFLALIKSAGRFAADRPELPA